MEQQRLRAAIYTRQSKDRDGEGLAVERQRTECLKLCERRGYEVVQEIEDNNKSATRGKRPGYAELVELIGQKAIDVAVILRIDRLMRLNTELEELIALSESTGVTVATVEGDVDISTPQGRLIARVLVSVAKNEMEVKSARTRLSNDQRAQQGRPHVGVRCFGYEPDNITPRASEAEAYREMVRQFLHGHSALDIARWLNSNGFTTSQGNPFYPMTVRGLLKSPRYNGIREHNGEQYPAVWDGLVDGETFEAVQLAMKARSIKSKQTLIKGRKYLLTGFVMCGKCGQPLSGTQRRDRAGSPVYRAYRCHSMSETQLQQGCGGIRRSAPALEHFIGELVLARLDTPALTELIGGQSEDGELRQLLEERGRLSERLNGFTDDYALGVFTRDQYVRAKHTVEDELASIERAIERRSKATVKIPAGKSIRDVWERETVDWKRSVIGLLISRIDVMPSHVKKHRIEVDGKMMILDPSALNVAWKV